ncbi:MAG: hypothetical protein HYX86_06515 [Chloroflexi bacterium]|nr:hypothetical protein [Chloroflexota bacterium]
MTNGFYCVYCNRNRSGTPNSEEARTREHFVPESIGGEWEIPVCWKCNQSANRKSDALLNEIIWSYELYRTGILEHNGYARLKNGNHVFGRFKYQTKPRAEDPSKVHHQFHWFNEVFYRREVPKEDIGYLVFYPGSPDRVRESTRAVAKIALGAIYYLANFRMEQKLLHEHIVAGLEFADLRAYAQFAEFNPGVKGRSNGIGLVSMTPEEAKTFILTLENPETRRHYISVEDSKQGTTVTVCLYSNYFWKVLVPNASLGLPFLHDETLLEDLEKVNLDKVGAHQYLDGTVPIVISWR